MCVLANLVNFVRIHTNLNILYNVQMYPPCILCVYLRVYIILKRLKKYRNLRAIALECLLSTYVNYFRSNFFLLPQVVTNKRALHLALVFILI